jgi:hypothetical protein
MTDYVLAGLVKRRGELAGEADALRARLAQIGTDLGHLDAVIRQFDPECDLAAIRPKRSRGPDAARRGERSRALLAVLREAEAPLAAAEIVRRMLARDGQDAADRKLARAFTKRVATALARQEKRGAVRAVRTPGRAAAWCVDR